MKDMEQMFEFLNLDDESDHEVELIQNMLFKSETNEMLFQYLKPMPQSQPAPEVSLTPAMVNETTLGAVDAETDHSIKNDGDDELPNNDIDDFDDNYTGSDVPEEQTVYTFQEGSYNYSNHSGFDCSADAESAQQYYYSEPPLNFSTTEEPMNFMDQFPQLPPQYPYVMPYESGSNAHVQYVPQDYRWPSVGFMDSTLPSPQPYSYHLPAPTNCNVIQNPNCCIGGMPPTTALPPLMPNIVGAAAYNNTNVVGIFRPQQNTNVGDIYHQIIERRAFMRRLSRKNKSKKNQKKRKQVGRRFQQGGMICNFCHNNKESEAVYRSHRLRDRNGLLTCPILMRHKCPTCGETGLNAHTRRFCPVQNEETNTYVYKGALASVGIRN